MVDMISTKLVDGLQHAITYEAKVGGSPANFGRFCHMQGGKINLHASVGADGIGDMCLQALKQAGIDTKNVARIHEKPTSVILVARSLSTPEFLPYRDADVMLNSISRESLDSCEIFHTSSFALSHDPAQGVLLQAMKEIQNQNKSISIDWNYSEKIWEQHNNSREVLQTAMTENTLLKISMDDVTRFWNNCNSVEVAKQYLDAYPNKMICLTDGAAGVHYKEGQGAWRFKTALPAQVKDTTGAGDAFWSGFIIAHRAGKNIDECVDNALSIARRRLEGEF